MSKMCALYTGNPQFKETLRTIGDFWTLRIVAVLESSDLRFCAIERALGDSNPATLTARLKKLEHYGIVARHHGDAGDSVYTLTEKGKKILPVVNALYDVSDELTD